MFCLVNLLKWLVSSKYANQIEQIRTTSDKANQKELKAALPAITPSGTFTERKEGALIKHSGLIQFDIDFKDNTHIRNYKELKQQIAMIPNVAYCGLSASGTGYWGLIVITNPHKHKEHFQYILNWFKKYNVNIDERPSNVASLRGYSFDPVAHFNHEAQPLSAYNIISQLQKIKPLKSASRLNSSNKTEQLLSLICERKIDITNSYNNWISIGFALADEFRETGRTYFHDLSQFHPKYNPNETISNTQLA